MGIGLGVFGYRYYEENGGRLPFLEQMTGKRTDEMVDEAARKLRSVKQQGQQKVNEQIGETARTTVSAVAQEIAEAEQAKAREDTRKLS